MILLLIHLYIFKIKITKHMESNKTGKMSRVKHAGIDYDITVLEENKRQLVKKACLGAYKKLCLFGRATLTFDMIFVILGVS